MSASSSSSMVGFLGQLVAPPENQGLSATAAQEIKQAAGDINGRAIEVLVTSKNKLKMQAAKDSVEAWAKGLIDMRCNVVVKGYGVSSDIDEQPHGLEHTRQGALNRLTNLKKELAEKENINQSTQDGKLRVLVSLENGIMLEKVPQVKKPDVFQTEQGVWVDRCVEAVEIWLNGKCWNVAAQSEGVITPKAEVEKSQVSGWKRTAGTFIEETYGWPNADWHGGIAGKGRKFIMEELAKAALGLSSFTGPIPKDTRKYDPEADKNMFLHYNAQEIDFFTPTEIDELLAKEMEGEIAQESHWREYIKTIPQPVQKIATNAPVPGPNGQPINTCSPILTEDLLVGYYAEVEDPQKGEKKDVLHIVLRWGKEGQWVMPGKRDRAYDNERSDISVQDANNSLMEKEVGLKRTDIVSHVVLGSFDDRKREERMITSSMISFILVNQKPVMIPGEKIGVPLHTLVKLVQGEIRIPRTPWDVEGHGMGRNHDSLLLSVFKTAAFHSLMERVKLQQVRFKELLKNNPRAKYPPLSGVDAPYECQVCFDVLVKATSICQNGHDVCGLCLRALQSCPTCRANPEPRPNLGLDKAVMLKYPEQYKERFRQIDNQPPATWRNDPSFTGYFIQYK